MKAKTYANRGQTFEEYLKYANARYAKNGVAIITKIPTEFIPLRNSRGQVCNVKVEHKSVVDFIGRYKQYPIAIEAKNTNQGTIRWDAVQPHQASFLNEWTNQPGTIGLVVLSFNLETFYAVPWTFWKEAYELRVLRDDRTSRKIVKAFGEEWEIPKKKSVRMEELLPKWKIPSNDRLLGMNYLKNAENYIVL